MKEKQDQENQRQWQVNPKTFGDILHGRYHTFFYLVTSYKKYNDKDILLLGWGRVDSSSRTSESLKTASVTIATSNLLCAAPAAKLTTSHFCAKASSGNVCQVGQKCNMIQFEWLSEYLSLFVQGDSGSPLMCRRDNQYVACGLVAGGNRACKIEHSSYFTRLSQFREWIVKKIEGKSCNSYPR